MSFALVTIAALLVAIVDMFSDLDAVDWLLSPWVGFPALAVAWVCAPAVARHLPLNRAKK
jgi:hypothetical protein